MFYPNAKCYELIRLSHFLKVKYRLYQLTMKKVYFTALLVVLITGSLFGSARSLLRAGRDRIMMERNNAKKQLQIKPAEYEQVKPVYYRRTSYRRAKPLGNEQGTLNAS